LYKKNKVFSNAALTLYHWPVSRKLAAGNSLVVIPNVFIANPFYRYLLTNSKAAWICAFAGLQNRFRVKPAVTNLG
jgi:hypothetical protein